MIGRLRRALARPEPEPAGGGLPWSKVYPDHGGDVGLDRVSYGRVRSVAASLTSVPLALANPARTGLVIVNDGTANLYVAFGPQASTTSYSAKVPAAGQLALSDPPIYLGDVFGVWDVANGAARITEDT